MDVKRLVAAVGAATALLLPATAAQADDARFGTRSCPAGHVGRIVWWYDLNNQYEDLAYICIYTGP